MSSEGVVAQIDSAIAAFFGSGNYFTVVLSGILVIILLWPILAGKDPDIHPFLLARQSHASPVRQPGESAIYRSHEISFRPLRKGLAVKDVGAPAWDPGRDGDLRDVWRTAARGATDAKGALTGQKGKFLTVLGRENIIEQSFDDVTRAINGIGKFLQGKGGKVIAVSLSNSVELLATVFVSAFYGFKPVLIPYALDHPLFQTLLSKTSADVLIAEAGAVDLETALSTVRSIKNIVLVVKEGSRHIDWTEKPDGAGQVDIFQWHDIVTESKASNEVPASEKDSKTGPVAAFWKDKGGQYELIEYPSETIVAGIGGLLHTLQNQHRISPSDVFLSAAPITESYALSWTMAALYSNATVALNSVAGNSVDLTLAVTGVSPTIVVASSGTISKYHEKIATSSPGLSEQFTIYLQKRNVQAGHLDVSSKPSSIGPALSKLRVLLVSQSDTDRSSRVPASVFAAVRLALGTRTAYALTSSAVAGAIAQTNILDYREKASKVNVGAPVSSLELYVVGDDQDIDQDIPKGKLVVRGPAVVGGKTELDVLARIDADRTITLL